MALVYALIHTHKDSSASSKNAKVAKIKCDPHTHANAHIVALLLEYYILFEKSKSSLVHF